MRFLIPLLCTLFMIATTRADSLTLYTSVDEPIARKVADAFTARTGHTVRLITDTEASKSIGIAERLRAEMNRPRADVWWGNEIFYTIGLADEGFFDPLADADVAAIDPKFVDAQHRFAGAGLRLRMIGASDGTTATGLSSLTDPAMKDQIVVSRPTAGTTGGHVAALYVLWGDAKADEFFRGLHRNNVSLVGGNSVAAQQVAAGNFKLCLTDNDDLAATNESGIGKINGIAPDQEGDDAIGTLAIPTTVALVKKPNRSPAAQQLAQYLLSPEAEQVMLDAHFIAASTRTDAEAKLKVKTMNVDYAEVAKAMPRAIQRSTALMEGREP